MPWVTQLTALAQSRPPRERESKSRLQESFQGSLWTSLCKPAWRLLMVWSQSVEDNDNWSLVTDRQERLLLLSTPSLTRRRTLKLEIPKSNSIAFTSPSDRRDPLSLTWSRSSRIMMPWNTLSSWLLLPQRLLHFNSWPHTPDALLLNISEITESTHSLSTTICPSRPSPTDRCPFYWEDLQEERPTQVMCSISTPDCWRELPRWMIPSGEEAWLPFQSSRLRLVMCQLISQQTSLVSPTDRSSWKQSCFTRESDQPSTSVCQSVESDLLPRSRPWSRLPVSSNSNSPNTEKSQPSLNSVQISTLPPNSCSTEVLNSLSCWSRNSS